MATLITYLLVSASGFNIQIIWQHVLQCVHISDFRWWSRSSRNSQVFIFHHRFLKHRAKRRPQINLDVLENARRHLAWRLLVAQRNLDSHSVKLSQLAPRQLVVWVLQILSALLNLRPQLNINIQHITRHLDLLMLLVINPFQHLLMLLIHGFIIDVFLALMQSSKISLGHLICS